MGAAWGHHIAGIQKLQNLELEIHQTIAKLWKVEQCAQLQNIKPAEEKSGGLHEPDLEIGNALVPKGTNNVGFEYQKGLP